MDPVMEDGVSQCVCLLCMSSHSGEEFSMAASIASSGKNSRYTERQPNKATASLISLGGELWGKQIIADKGS